MFDRWTVGTHIRYALNGTSMTRSTVYHPSGDYTTRSIAHRKWPMTDAEFGTKRNMRLAGGRRVRVFDLLQSGLLEAGDQLVFGRPRHGEKHIAHITSDGRIRLEDGQEFATPSSAAQAAAGGGSIDGWAVWVVTRSDELLDSVRQRYLDQLSGVPLERHDESSSDGSQPTPHEFLKQSRDRATNSEPHNLTVRELIKRWGSTTRSATVDSIIEDDLANYGLTTIPSFRKVGLETPVMIQLVARTDQTHDLPPSDGDEEGGTDRGLTLGNLSSALGGVVSISPQSTYDEAITKLLLDDYSQLAVLAGPHNLRGAITWRSIARARHDDPDATISDAIVQTDAVLYDKELVDVLRRLYEEDFIFVRGPDNRISGIITTADVALAYGELSMPFLLVGQIDMLLRRLITRHLVLEDLISICDPESLRQLHDFDELTFGDYQRALESPPVWEQLNWRIDRPTFGHRLDEIRRLRNDITHFNPDPLPADAMNTLRSFMLFLKHYVK